MFNSLLPRFYRLPGIGSITRGATNLVAENTRAVSPPLKGTSHQCPTYGRDFRARIGLISHLRAHYNRNVNLI